MGFSMEFSTLNYPATVCLNATTDAIQINYDALKNNDVDTAVFRNIVHLELYGSFNEETAEGILRQLVKFKNLDTLSLVTPPWPFAGALVQLSDSSSDRVMFLKHGLEVSMTKNLVSFLMTEPQYDTWKKPLLSQICPRYDGSRYISGGEFNPVWSLAHFRDFSKKSMQSHLEDFRRSQETQAA
jgi:hypothetical protein